MLILPKPLAMKLHNFHSARKTGKQLGHVPTFTSSLGSQVPLWGQPPGTTSETPRTEEYVHKGVGKICYKFQGNYIKHMFILEN